MCSYALTALRFSFLLIFAVQELSACAWGPCPDEDDEMFPQSDIFSEFEVTPKCLKQLYNTEKYPYLAIVYSKCDKESGASLGVIISDSRVLIVTSPIMKNIKNCEYTVLAGADQHAKGGSEHKAESVKIGDKEELTLLKLKTPIEFGPRAKSIPLVSKKPKVGSQALFNSWIANLEEKKREGILATNVTLIDKTECEKLISWNYHYTDRFNGYGNSFCTRNFDSPCPYSSSVLIADGQLAGLNNDAYDAVQEINSKNKVYSFYDLAHYSRSIKDHV